MSSSLGRPTLYNENTVERAQQYLSDARDSYDEVTKNIVVDLPSVEGLALYLGVSRDTLYEWSRVHPDFSDTLATIKAKQRKVLIDKGLSGDYNSVIAKLVLSSNHGMSEKVETDITSKGESISSSEDLKALSAKFDEFFKKENS